MPQSSAEPASKLVSKTAGHPLALPSHPGPIISVMTLASTPVPEPESLPAPSSPIRLGVRKKIRGQVIPAGWRPGPSICMQITM